MRGRFIASLASLLALTFSLLALTGCKEQPTSHPQSVSSSSIVTAQLVQTHSHLYYSGSITPLITTNALSPVDGRITDRLFQYGDQINKGQPLAIINSTQLADDYHQNVNGFLEKKDAMQHQAFLFKGTAKLWEAQVIAKYEYLQGKSALETSRLEYLQAKYELEKVLKKAGVNPADIENLTLDKTNEVDNLLKKQFSHIVVTANSSGVALYPSNTSHSKSDDELNEEIEVGREVKTGQLVLAIGDQHGLSTHIQVSEIDVNRLKVGMPVKVTGDAFPEIILDGRIQSIASQAQRSESGDSNVGQFDVIIEIPKVMLDQLKVIHVGMSCKVNISIENAKSIMLPIQAVWERGGQHYVTVFDSKTKQRFDRAVMTGQTTLSSVAILSGVHEGEQIVV